MNAAVSEPTLRLEPVMLGYAVRYALPRRTYAVHHVVQALKQHASHLPESLRVQIVQDIRVGLAADRGPAEFGGTSQTSSAHLTALWHEALDALDPLAKRNGTSASGSSAGGSSS